MKTSLRIAVLSTLIFSLAGWCQNIYSQVVINEYSASNLSSFQDNYNNYEDWIELYNQGATTANIGGYRLSDNPDNPFKYTFSFNISIPAEGFLRIWTSGRDEASTGHIHTNFRLTQTKKDTETIVLSDPLGNIIDIQELRITQKEHSCGRISDGSSEWGIFPNPTPGTSNNTAVFYERYAKTPVMSDSAGFYANPLSISITTSEPNATIHYTTDGQTPTSASPVYSGQVNVASTTLLQARVYSSNPQVLPGLIEFNTYFINEAHNLVVLSASGNTLTELLNGNVSLRPFGSMEYFNMEGVRTTRSYGEFNKHGQDSWVNPQRSIDYISRDECGYKHALEGKILSLSDRTEFQRIIIRASGDDNYPGKDTGAHMRDFLIQNLAEKIGMHLDVRKGERCVLYANGQYWGIYAIREKVNDHDFTGFYYDQGKYDIQYLMLWGSTWARYGGPQAFTDWNNLHDFIKYQDMTSVDNYDYVTSLYDIRSLVDYIHINSYVVCSDWINWNVGWWRGLNPEGGHQKWGYVLWDEDATFGHYINYTGIPGQHPYVPPCFPEGITADPEEHILALNKLRTNPVFKQYYISRYIDLLNTGLHIDYVIPWIDSLAALIEDEMPRHVNRWGGSVNQWQNNVQKIRNFTTNRFGYLTQGLIDCYSLTGPYPLTFIVEPENAGIIHLNSLTLNSFPWQGNYFGGIDVLLKAVPSAISLTFDSWELQNHTVLPYDTVNEVSLQLLAGDTIIARFKPKTFTDSLVINEINYNSHPDFDPEDWVEFYNPHPYTLHIEGWMFKDSDDDHIYVFPSNTVIQANGYLVLCRDTSLFDPLFPEVSNRLGNMNFGFSGAGELIRLYNAEGALVDSVHYDDDLPWPPEPDGNGPTLELIAPHLDNALAENWKSSMGFGTPGEENSPQVAITKPEYHPHLLSLSPVPNPFSHSTTITIHSNRRVKNGELVMYNFAGEAVQQISGINTNKVVLYRVNYPSGVYFLKYIDLDTGVSAVCKLIAE